MSKYYLGAPNALGRDEEYNLIMKDTLSLSLSFDDLLGYYNKGKKWFQKAKHGNDIYQHLYSSYKAQALEFSSLHDAVEWKEENKKQWLHVLEL